MLLFFFVGIVYVPFYNNSVLALFFPWWALALTLGSDFCSGFGSSTDFGSDSGFNSSFWFLALVLADSSSDSSSGRGSGTKFKFC